MTPKSLYDTAKWAALVGLPALAVFVVSVGTIWGIPHAQAISTTIVALSVFLGSIVGISSAKHTAAQKEIDNG